MFSIPEPSGGENRYTILMLLGERALAIKGRIYVSKVL